MSRFGPKYTPEFRERLMVLHRAGRSIESLAREFKPRASTIAHWVDEYARDARQHAEDPTSAEQAQGLLSMYVDGSPPFKASGMHSMFSPLDANWRRRSRIRDLLFRVKRELAGTKAPPFGKDDRLGLTLEINSRGLREVPVDCLSGVVDALSDRRRAFASRWVPGARRFFGSLLSLHVVPDEKMILEASVNLQRASYNGYVVRIWRLDPPSQPAGSLGAATPPSAPSS